MTKEIVDGGTFYCRLLEDAQGVDYHICIREDGSISLYGTMDAIIPSGHLVIYDTLYNEPPTKMSQIIIDRLADMAEGINALLKAVEASK